MDDPVRPEPTQPPATSALVIYRPLVEKVVAALGALVTHQVAYLLAAAADPGSGPLTDHGHLSLQWAIVTPLAVGAAAGFVVWQLKSLGFRSHLSAGHLGSMVVAFFLVQESLEGLAAGVSIGRLLQHPAIAIGVLMAPIVGWLLSRLLAGVTELAARLLATADLPSPISRPLLVPLPVSCRSTGAGSPSRPRAPPSTLRS